MKKLSFYSLLFLFPLMGVAQAQLDSGLVAHYAFCGDAADRSGNGNQGTLVGDASFGPDRNGEPDAALVLDGNGDYVDIASTSSLEQAEDQVSIALWFNTQSYFQGRWAVMLTKSDQAPLDSRQYSLYYEQNGTIYFNSDIIAVEPIPLDSWQHLAVTFSEANVMRCYLNGSLLAQDTLADTLIPNPWPVHLGRDIPGVNEFYHGSLDEVRIYDRVLDSTEIVALYTDSSDCSITSIQAQAKVSLQVFPNPSRGIWRVEMEAPSSFPLTWQVYDLNGRLMDQGQGKRKELLEINGEPWPRGLYCLKVGDQNRIIRLE